MLREAGHSADRQDPLAARRIADNFFAAYSWFHVSFPALTLHPLGELSCLYAPGGLVDFNLAMPSPGFWPVPAKALEADSPLAIDLEAVRAFFAARHTGWSCWFAPSEQPFPEAQALGFSGYAEHMGQYLALEQLVLPQLAPKQTSGMAAGFELRRVTQSKELAVFADLIAAGWDLDPTAYRRFYQAQAPRLLDPACPKRWYIGWMDGCPACCMESFMQAATQHQEGVVGVYYVTTHHNFRRQGLALRMQAEVLAAARREGYMHATVLSAPGEARLMAQLGFRDYGVWREYWTV